MKKRILLALSLAAVMGFMAIACDNGDSDDGGSDIPELYTEGYDGFPISEDVIELNFMNMQTELLADFNTIWFFEALAEKSNIHITFENVPSASLAERRNLAILAEEQPDAYFKMNFPQTDIAKFSADGIFVPIDEYFDEHMPNFSAVLEEHPDIEVGLTMPDGRIYSTNYVIDHYAIRSGVRYWFNGDALEGIGKEVPTTIDELTDVLRLLKDYDLNGNGEADEIPLTSSSLDGVITPLLGSWGLGNRGAANIVDMGEDGQARYIYTTDEYREVLEYVHMLYQEELIDPDIFTVTTAELVAKGTEQRAPVYAFVNHSIIGAEAEKSLPMEQPFEGPHGDTLWRNTGTALSGPGAFLVTNQNEHVLETVKWIDFFYSDAGVRNYFMGIEGENYDSPAPATFYIDEDGNAEYNKHVMENEELMFEEVLGSVVPWPGGGNPSIAGEKYFKGGEMQSLTREAADNLQPYMPETIWPTPVWEADEVDDMSRISADISTHHNESRAAFIAGTTPINDETWQAYIDGFDEVELERYMEIFNNAIERYGLE